MAKPFEISKRVVWEAYEKVKANQGAAGVDGESIEEFERDLQEEPLQALESDVLGELFPTAGPGGGDTEEGQRGSRSSACLLWPTGLPRRSCGMYLEPEVEPHLPPRLLRLSTGALCS